MFETKSQHAPQTVDIPRRFFLSKRIELMPSDINININITIFRILLDDLISEIHAMKFIKRSTLLSQNILKLNRTSLQ